MDDKEEKEFHEVWDKLCDDGYRTAYEAARHCWVAARRSQPSVVLPKPWASKEGSLTPDLSTWYRADLVNKRLTAAGIKYTIGE